MLDFLFKALTVAAGIGAIIVGAIVIKGMITKAKIKAELQKKNVRAALVDAIDNCDNIVKLEDIDRGSEIEIRGDSVSRDIYVGETIYA